MAPDRVADEVIAIDAIVLNEKVWFLETLGGHLGHGSGSGGRWTAGRGGVSGKRDVISDMAFNMTDIDI